MYNMYYVSPDRTGAKEVLAFFSFSLKHKLTHPLPTIHINQLLNLRQPFRWPACSQSIIPNKIHLWSMTSDHVDYPTLKANINFRVASWRIKNYAPFYMPLFWFIKKITMGAGPCLSSILIVYLILPFTV